jgi:capsule polysaccharide export protein KpsC/LpsZ
MDYCLTVRGTIGIEAALFGIPVITAGTGRYDNFGFTIDSTSKEDYLEKLSRVHNFPALTPEQTNLAHKFAYATFILRPFEVKNMRISFTKDEKAMLNVSFTPRTKEDVLQAEDLRLLGDWAVNSRDEDYLDTKKLRELQRSA